jgi:hypothetical protein
LNDFDTGNISNYGINMICSIRIFIKRNIEGYPAAPPDKAKYQDKYQRKGYAEHYGRRTSENSPQTRPGDGKHGTGLTVTTFHNSFNMRANLSFYFPKAKKPEKE